MSASDLLEAQINPDKIFKRPFNRQHDSTLFEKLHRFRHVILVISIPLLIFAFVLFLIPASNNLAIRGGNVGLRSKLRSKSYAVIFDAGSSGSRVHVFCFDHRLDLVSIGEDLELFVQQKPGLSAYEDPKLAAESLLPLLEKAKEVVPRQLLKATAVRVGATAGLRALGAAKSENILQEVRNLLKEKSGMMTQADWVTVLDGSQEGSYEWVTINYLLGNLGKDYSSTVGVVDLGGGSVQMAYAISKAEAAKAPRISDGEDTYVKEMYLKGVKYYLYVHSYLRYGLLAARAEILGVSKGADHNPCILSGFHGSYNYGGDAFKASALPSGASVEECMGVALEALKVNESTCTHMKCTFGGVWNGGGGDGQKNLFVASFFFDRAAEAGFVDSDKPTAEVKPHDFKVAAQKACETRIEDAESAYPNVEKDNLPYLCMDLSYQYTLLTKGFELDPWQTITLVKKVPYGMYQVEAAWPLGSAIEVVSSQR